MNKSDAAQQLRLPPDDDFVMALRHILSEYRPGNWLTIRQAAALADISVRTLQRRLAAEGWTYSALVDDVRRLLAIKLMKDANAQLSAIASQLGYTEPSNFVRAFRRWTGKAPTEFRQLPGNSE